MLCFLLCKFIEISGGNYSGELKQNSTNILIINGDPKSSKKYMHARSWNLTCVKSSWVYDSVEKGYALNSQEYSVTPKVKSSTPTENKTEMPSKYLF